MAEKYPLHIHALEKVKSQSLMGTSLALGNLSGRQVRFLQRQVGEWWSAGRPADATLTFAIIVGLSDLQKAEDAGHAAEPCMRIGLLQTEHRALEQV